MGRLDGKVVLVTGAASGIGRASAVMMAQEGASVMCADLDLVGADQTVAEVASVGGTASSLSLDVTDEQSVLGALEKTLKDFGGLNVLFNNAGVSAFSPGMDWQKVLGVNLSGVSYGLFHGASMLADLGGGSIINTTSIAGLVGVGSGLSDAEPDPVQQYAATAYVASKHGVSGLTKQYAIMFGQKAVRVNAIAPGYIETPMTAGVKEDAAVLDQLVSQHPIGRSGTPDEVAAAATFLASDESSFITGVVLPVDGGYTAQ